MPDHTTNDYIIFNSNQIKTVKNTNPTDNLDIRYSIEEDNYTFDFAKNENKCILTWI